MLPFCELSVGVCKAVAVGVAGVNTQVCAWQEDAPALQTLHTPVHVVPVVCAVQLPAPLHAFLIIVWLLHEYVSHPDGLVPAATNESDGHACALHVSATSHTPVLARQVKPSLFDHAVVLVAVLQIWQVLPVFAVPLA